MLHAEPNLETIVERNDRRLTFQVSVDNFVSGRADVRIAASVRFTIHRFGTL